MTDIDLTQALREYGDQVLKGGFTQVGDVIVYYNEAGDNGISVADLIAMQALSGFEWKKWKETLKPVKSREVALPQPQVKTDYGGWESRYQELFRQAGISFAEGTDVKPDFTKTEKERALIREVYFKPSQVESFSPSNKPNLKTLYKVEKSGDEVVGIKVREAFPYYDRTKLSKPPFYQPAYKSLPPDLGLFNRLSKISSQVPLKQYEEFATVYMKLQEASEKYVLTSGNFRGQVGRILKGFKVREQIDGAMRNAKGNNLLIDAYRSLYDESAKMDDECKRHSMYEPRITRSHFRAIMKKRCPLNERPDTAILNSNDIYAMAVYWELVNPVGFKLFQINIGSSSGFWLRPLKKEESWSTDMVQAQELLQALEDCVVGNTISIKSYKEVLEEYGTLLMPETKNKEEVMERDKLEIDKVSRNYFVFNSFVQLPAQILFGNSFKNKYAKIPLYKNSKRPDSWSLLGWSSYHSGLQDLLKFMIEESDNQGYSIAVYSDNVYVMHKCRDEYWWYSLDGSSMEVSIGHADAVYLMDYIIKEYWGTQNVTRGFRVYAEHLWPDVSVDGVAILANMQWRNKGQFSGQGGTAYVNNAKMIMRATVLDYRLKNWPKDTPLLRENVGMPGPNSTKVYGERVLAKELDEAFALGGISLKVELVTRSAIFEYLKGGLKPSLGNEEGQHLVRLDLLGMDGVFIPWMEEIGGKYPFFPVLTESKLLPGFIYSKIRGEYTQAERRILDIARLKAYYILGCWRFKPLAALIRDRIASRDVIRGGQDVIVGDDIGHTERVQQQILAVASGLNEDAALAIATALQSFKLPSFYDVLCIYHDVEFARKTILGLILKRGPFATLAYANVWDVLRALGLWLETELSNQKEIEMNEQIYEEIVKFLRQATTADDTPEGDGADLRATIERIQNTLVVRSEDIILIKGILDKPSSETFEITSRNLIVYPDDSVKPKSIQKDYSSTNDFKDVYGRVASRKSFTMSQKEKVQMRPLSVQSENKVNQVLHYVKQNGVKLGDIYDYAEMFRKSGVSKHDLDDIKQKKELTQFFLHLDHHLEKFASKSLQKRAGNTSSKPQVTTETVIRRIERKEDRKGKKEDKRLKDLEEAHERTIRISETNERIKKEKKKLDKEKKKENQRRASISSEENIPSIPAVKLARNFIKNKGDFNDKEMLKSVKFLSNNPSRKAVVLKGLRLRPEWKRLLLDPSSEEGLEEIYTLLGLMRRGWQDPIHVSSNIGVYKSIGRRFLDLLNQDKDLDSIIIHSSD